MPLPPTALDLPEPILARHVARFLGIERQTFATYLVRPLKTHPVPPPTGKDDAGRNYWSGDDAELLRAWVRNRPGMGNHAKPAAVVVDDPTA